MQPPVNARRYIQGIEALTEVRAALVLVGPGRQETIVVREIFS